MNKKSLAGRNQLEITILSYFYMKTAREIEQKMFPDTTSPRVSKHNSEKMYILIFVFIFSPFDDFDVFTNT